MIDACFYYHKSTENGWAEKGFSSFPMSPSKILQVSYRYMGKSTSTTFQKDKLMQKNNNSDNTNFRMKPEVRPDVPKRLVTSVPFITPS